MTVMAAPDLEAIKAKQQQAWASGDYSAIAATIPIISEQLCDAADLRAGSRVLDVAGGSGNTALAAARCGAEVVSIDYVPSLLERSRDRAAAEGLRYETVVGDAEALPFDDASFDAIISAVGVMFAPDHQRAAAELLRVCRPGGTIALANWAPDGFIGELFLTTAAHVPPPAGLQPPAHWGIQGHVRSLLGDGVTDLSARRRTYTFRYRSPEHFVDFFRTWYGPTHKAFAALGAAGQQALADDIAALVADWDRLIGEDAVAVPADYLEIVATRAGHVALAA
jgi:ubiquinone/menaquinone biosynthesis C-methylase UbiE